MAMKNSVKCVDKGDPKGGGKSGPIKSKRGWGSAKKGR
jgi:hypothetical protein